DVSQDQRKHIFEMRRELLTSSTIGEQIEAMRAELLSSLVHRHMPATAYAEQFTIRQLTSDVGDYFNVLLPLERWAAVEGVGAAERGRQIAAGVAEVWQQRQFIMTKAEFDHASRQVMLSSLDDSWRDHIGALEDLRFGVMLRAFAQQEPIHEYKREAF